MRLSRAARQRSALLATVSTVASLLLLAPTPAQADTDPPAGTPATVSADALPTWQLNGVVWSQVVAGNTVYATGSFTKARPPGVAAGGAGEVAAGNIFAYDIRTGARVASFNHTLNAQGRAIKASPDGSRVYVAGDFTTVDGVAKGHVAAFDTTTGNLVGSFAANVPGRANALAISNDTVYVGGNFFSANGQTRRRLAAFATSNGAVRPWAPTADDDQVTSMVLAPGGDRVIVGGKFSTLNGASARAMGSVDATSGESRPWAINQVMNNAGSGSSITSLSTDGTNVYGTGFAFETGNFEGTFAAKPATGDVVWLTDCHGDTYDAFPKDGVVYTVSHAHDCRWIGQFPQTDDNWNINMRHALAFTADARGTNVGPDNYGWNYNGQPAAGLLQWYPELTKGTFTGQNQAAWSVAGNSDYTVLGGEFPRVNGTAQQGLVRFAKRPIAPNKRGPVSASGAPAPTAMSVRSGTARVGWQAAYDMDNEELTYEVFRSGTTAPVYTTKQRSNYWTYPGMGFQDTGLTPGASYRYTVRITDPLGNVRSLPQTPAVTISNAGASAYTDEVVEDGATAFWRLGEASGTAVYDYAGFNDAQASSGVTRGATGAINGDSDKASTFDGTDNGNVASRATMPATPDLTVEAWVKTTSTSGGKIVGYGGAASGDSSSYDRHLYLTNDGRATFGVYPGGVRTLTSSPGLNDGQWHHVVGTLGRSEGMALYVDGKRVGTDGGTTSAQEYAGYWRIGGDNLNGWPNQPGSNDLAGSIDDVAIYPSALSRTQVQAHFEKSGRTVAIPAKPTDAYGKAVYESEPELQWRLGESSGGTAADVSPNSRNGSYFGGVTQGAAGAVSGTSNTAVRFDGDSAGVGSVDQVTGPSRYSEELWFKTTTTRGGKLIGFGDQPNGLSNNYDRHVYLEDSGQLTFGVWTGQANTITSPKSYNDGSWHHLVASQGVNGMAMYVDGVEVGTNPQTDQQPYAGHWRVGGDRTWGGSSNFFAGTIDEVAIYGRALPGDEVRSHFVAGGGSLPNATPKAAFSSTSTGLKASFDAAGSSDTDGSVDSYAWTFGDGESGTGKTPEHRYAAPGDYQVTLTVTDDRGATDTLTKTVTISNEAPTAAFSAATDDLALAVDASDSADSDGTIESYRWNWGDGTAAGSGRTADHTYAAPGDYTVRLTVTDDGGATGTRDRVVTVTKPAVLATDTFTRTASRAWGPADTGGSWVTRGTASNFNVGGGIGTMTQPTTGIGPWAYLDGVSETSTDTAVTFALDKPATGTGMYVTVIGRSVDSVGSYRAVLNVRANGSAVVTLVRRTWAGQQSVLASAVVPNLTVTPGTGVRLRMVAQGSGSTALKAKAWAAGTTEPATWQVSTTDTTSEYQAAGTVGLMSYISANSTNAPVVTSFDDFTAVPAD